MNDFEIRAIKEDLKSHGIKNIYKISKKYNMQEYERIQMNIVVEYVYKNEIYYTDLKFETKDIINKKSDHIKNKIAKNKEEIEDKLYNEKSPLRMDYISYFIREKIRLIQAIKQKTRTPIEGYASNRVWCAVKTAIDKKMTRIQAYQEGLKQAKEEVNINE